MNKFFKSKEEEVDPQEVYRAAYESPTELIADIEKIIADNKTNVEMNKEREESLHRICSAVYTLPEKMIPFMEDVPEANRPKLQAELDRFSIKAKEALDHYIKNKATFFMQDLAYPPVDSDPESQKPENQFDIEELIYQLKSTFEQK